MLYNIYYGNHNYAGVEDQLSYLYNGFDYIGQNALYSDKYYMNGVNIILENNINDFYKMMSRMRKLHQRSKIVFVATEIIKDGIFNSGNVEFNIKPTEGEAQSHYSNYEYWKYRYDSFLEFLPSIDCIICYSEQLVAEYQKLHKNVFYLPLAYPDNFVPLKRKPFERRSIDCIFTGTFENEYRQKILQEIKKKGNLNVTILNGSTPKYIRDEYFSRTKIAIGIKISEKAGLLSKFRAFYCLTNKIEHLFEVPTDYTDLNEYLNFCSDNSNFVDELIQSVKNARDIPQQKFDDYRQSEKLVYSEIFENMHRFIND
jgi:hypothetical protein